MQRWENYFEADGHILALLNAKNIPTHVDHTPTLLKMQQEADNLSPSQLYLVADFLRVPVHPTSQVGSGLNVI